MNLSGCCFIRNAFAGAYMLPESVAQFLPFVDDMVIMDLGSTDGTIEFLTEISRANPKIKVILRDGFPFEDANVFATLANDLIKLCKYPDVIYWQSDEIWHEYTLQLMEKRLQNGLTDLSFWRIQFANNFQYVKWYPHLVHRVGHKDNFNFTGDGMNTNRVWDAKICSNYGGEMFPKWGELGHEGIKPYIHEMVTNVSLIGGFRDNIPDRRRMHAPFWHESPTIPYYDKETGKQPHMQEMEWRIKAMGDSDWTKQTSPFDLPNILKYHVGKTKYELRPGLMEAIRADDTRNLLGI